MINPCNGLEQEVAAMHDLELKDLKNKGLIHFNQGRFAEAVKSFSEAVALYPTDGQAHYYLARARWDLADESPIPSLQRKQEYVQIAEGFREAKKYGEDSDELHQFLAIAVQLKPVRHVERKQKGHSESFHESTRSLEVLAKRKSMPGLVSYFRGKNNYRLGKYLEAEKYLALALNVEGQHKIYLPLSWRYLGLTQLKLEKYRDAIVSAEKSEALCGNLWDVDKWQYDFTMLASWRTRAVAHCFLKEFDKALPFFNLYLGKRKDKINMLMLRAKTHFMLHNYDLAITDWEDVISVKGPNEELLGLLDAARKFRQRPLEIPAGLSYGQAPVFSQAPASPRSSLEFFRPQPASSAPLFDQSPSPRKLPGPRKSGDCIIL